jgi:2-polyprenyl-3-methyl-5-hydroxy-6-metoxy-1,4-benzoquinol methylase
MNIDLIKSEIGCGQYDDAYSQCDLLWGEHPASNVVKASKYFDTCSTKKALDLGCGEGKNSIYLASQGFEVKSVDISEIAIKKAKRHWAFQYEIDWKVGDIRLFKHQLNYFHVVLLTGPLHCFTSEDEVFQIIENTKLLTKAGGINVISVFNSREQNFCGHSKYFNPLLLPHDFYLDCYKKDWLILEESDTNLADCHPHNNIPHNHSITRFIAQKGPSLTSI